VDLQEILKLLLSVSKSTLITILGMLFLAAAILGKVKDWTHLKTRNERIIAGLLGAFIIIIGFTSEPIPPNLLSGSSSSQIQSSPTIANEKLRIRISGSTTVAQYNKRFKQDFEKKYPGAKIEYTTEGSELGLLDVYKGEADIAAISRELEDSEKKDFVAKYLGSDDIAVVVGKNNPWKGSLTMQQLDYIFQGKYQKWSEVGVPSKEKIIVWNRPQFSGTYKTFQEIVLKRQEFGKTNNIKQLEKDGATYWIKELKNNGIGYASCPQICKESMVRGVPIDGYSPGQGDYPITRKLYYVYKKTH
jgi:phosphate transport system substrate-binding protein